MPSSAAAAGAARRRQKPSFVCSWCRKPSFSHTMSMFCLDPICLECKERERKHPLYAWACEVEAEAVKRGDLNFPGIGKPEDL
jgi:hypothetical protein